MYLSTKQVGDLIWTMDYTINYYYTMSMYYQFNVTLLFGVLPVMYIVK